MTLNFSNDDGLVPVYMGIIGVTVLRYLLDMFLDMTYIVWRLNRRGRAGGLKLKAFRLVDHSSRRFIMTAWCRNNVRSGVTCRSLKHSRILKDSWTRIE